jgi:hypothetical protein
LELAGPHDDEASIHAGGHAGAFLVEARIRIVAKLGPGARAVGTEAENASSTAVACLAVLPHGNEAAVRQPSEGYTWLPGV